LDQKPRRIDTTSDRFAPSRSGDAPRPSTCQDRQVVRLRFVVRPPIPPPGGGVSTDTLDALPFLRYAVVKVQETISFAPADGRRQTGGLRWIRTTDLTLIRGAL